MKTFKLLLLLPLLAIASCRDHIDIDDMHNDSKLVVYAFPSSADTTLLSITNSIGVRSYTNEQTIQPQTDAEVSYAVNGQPYAAERQDDGQILVVAPHRAGDRIDMSVSKAGYAPVRASTVVPDRVDVRLRSINIVTAYDPDWEGTRQYFQLQATFADPAGSHDYYAVRVALQRVLAPYEVYKQYPQITTTDEPLLRQLSDMDEDFGYESYNYGGLYIFNDLTINGQTYTLRLNIDCYPVYDDVPVRVELFHLSPEYYRFLKSINDMESNELAQNGLAQISPTYSNVRGGLGVVGAYAVAVTPWQSLSYAE